MSDRDFRLGRLNELLTSSGERLVGEAHKGELKQSEQRVDQVLEEISQSVRTSRQFRIGQLDIDAAVEQLPAFRCLHGVVLKADNDNTGVIYVGDNARMVAGAVDGLGLGGFELGAGDAVILPVRELSDLYAIASAANQYLNVVAV